MGALAHQICSYRRLALNLLMIASTPTTGSHYFIDVVGGTAVAFLAIAAASGCRRACAAPKAELEIGQPGLADQPIRIVG
jgi:hypothetical protein